MEQRRVEFKIGVVYGTPLEKLKEIPDIIKMSINSIEKTSFQRAHFISYGDFSLDFEIVYNVLSSDYDTYVDIQQKINQRIYEYFEKEKIEFAYPTQTIFIEKQAK